MYISSFHINGFGLFCDVEVGNISPGLNIFLGSNEAGKSTCLDFLRAMLTGYPDKRNREARRKYEPPRGVTPGGSLDVRYFSPDGIWEEMRIFRKPGRNGLNLRDASGKALSEDFLASLMAGVSQQVYHKVFGFSLGELEHFESLSEDGVRNALYGASFGPGLRSPAEALKIIARQKEDIFKPYGTKSPLNAAIGQLEEIRSTITAQSGMCEKYDALCLERDNNRQALESLLQNKTALDGERRILERRLDVWHQWEQWRQNRILLENMPVHSGEIPEDAAAIMASLREAVNSCERHVAGSSEKIALLKAQLDSHAVDTGLLANLANLRRLAERKNSYRQALMQVPVQLEDCARIEAELEHNLGQLGPDWNCDRIRATDRSLFAREDLEKQAREMNAAVLAHQAAMDNLGKSNTDVEGADEALLRAREILENLPDPEAVLNGHERDELRRDMARLEEDRRIEPGRDRALKLAQESFVRAINQANIVVANAADDETYCDNAASAVDNLLAHQELALELAGEMQNHIAESEQAANRLVSAEEKVDGIRRQMEELRATSMSDEAPVTRQMLDTRMRALRSLRSVSTTLEGEKERLSEIEARINSETPPKRISSGLMLICAVLCLLAGAAILGAIWFLGLSSVVVGSTVIPLNLATAYAALICGVILLAGGMPGNSREKRRHKQELEQLQGRRETSSRRIADLEAQISRLYAEAGVNDADPISLDVTEALIEREKEKCFHEERARKEMERLLADLNAARERVGECQRNSQQLESAVQQCRKRWHDLMQTLQIGNAPTPESATTVFARADAAKFAYGNYRTARQELDALWEDLHFLEGKITSLPAIASKLSESSQPMGMEEAVRLILEECRDADIAREHRIHAQAVLQNCENDLGKARIRQEEAARQLETASSRLEQARNEWSKRLSGFGLGENLDPETVRQAFKFMENCLAAEQKLHDTKRSLEQNREELEAFGTPIAKLLDMLERRPALDADGQPDWLMTLDNLLAEAEDNANRQNDCDSLQKQISAEEITLNSENATLENIMAKMNDLFGKACVENEDEFLAAARQKNERETLERNIASLESSLAIAADTQPLGEFLESFRQDERESQEKRLEDIRKQLAQLNEQEKELSARSGALMLEIQTLSHSGELAAQKQEESMLLAEIDRMSKSWGQRALAEALLLKAKNIFEQERQPEVIKVASDIFSQITNGRWRGLGATLDDYSRIDILPQHGEPKDQDYLSRGTQEQAYLALRLAYIRNHAEHATSLPVIMDEILVNFDPERAERAARSFTRLTAATGRLAQQIIYFTCQPYMVDILRSAAPSAPLFIVENGGIHAA